jgi:hypothetical protein
LHAFDRHYGALKMEAGAGPLDQEALVLALHSTLGPMGAHGDEPEQGIEVETAECPNVGADAQIPLCEQGSDGERQADSHHCSQHRHGRTQRIEPDNACSHQGELTDEPEELAAEVWQEA